MRYLPLQTLSQHREICPWHSRPQRFCRTGDSLLHSCAKSYLYSSLPVLDLHFSPGNFKKQISIKKCTYLRKVLCLCFTNVSLIIHHLPDICMNDMPGLESIVTVYKPCLRYICKAQIVSELGKIWSNFGFARNII